VRVLTPAQVAEVLQVPERTVRDLCARGELAGARKVGRCWRVPEWSIDAFFAPGEHGGPTADSAEGVRAWRDRSRAPEAWTAIATSSSPASTWAPRAPRERAAHRRTFLAALDGDARPNRRGARRLEERGS
jgi:excisionase family DNA binding protein